MKIALISNPLIQKLGYGDYLYRGFSELCESVHFNTGDETEGFDYYFYIDDGPSYYDAPKFHPATYIAIDFVVPHVWFVDDHQTYIKRMRNFDHSYVFSTSALKMCKENGLNTNLTAFAADPYYHKQYFIDKIYDWIAIWHNCGERIQAIEAAIQAFPNGRVMWAGNGPTWLSDKDYSYWMCTANCALNYPRANIVNMRVFEVMSMGVPLITMRLEDMNILKFKEGIHYLGFKDIEEMLFQINFIQCHSKSAQEFAEYTRTIILRNHTYRHRAEEMLEMI